MSIKKSWLTKSVNKNYSLNYGKLLSNGKLRTLLSKCKHYFRRMKGFFAFIENITAKVWTLIMFVLWLLYLAGNFVEFLCYLTIFAMLKCMEILQDACQRAYMKIFYTIKTRTSSSSLDAVVNLPKISDFTTVLDLDETLIHTSDDPPSLFDYDYFTIMVILTVATFGNNRTLKERRITCTNGRIWTIS